MARKRKGRKSRKLGRKGSLRTPMMSRMGGR
jgi:hypothetical protein